MSTNLKTTTTSWAELWKWAGNASCRKEENVGRRSTTRCRDKSNLKMEFQDASRLEELTVLSTDSKATIKGRPAKREVWWWWGWISETHRWGLMVLWSFQFDTNVCPLPTLKFTNTWSIIALKQSFMGGCLWMPCSRREASKWRTCLTWGVPTAGGAGAAAAVLQPRAVGEGVSLVWRPGRRQTLLESAQRSERVIRAHVSQRWGWGRCAVSVLTMPVS